jgi:hypothetical protein
LRVDAAATAAGRGPAAMDLFGFARRGEGLGDEVRVMDTAKHNGLVKASRILGLYGRCFCVYVESRC